MKRGIYFLAIILVFILIIARFLEPSAIYLMKRWLEKELSASVVSIASFKLLPLGTLELTGIEISKPGDFDLRANRVGLGYIPFFLFKNALRGGQLNEAITAIELDVAAFKGVGFQIQGASLKIDQKQETGNFSIRLIQYGKAKIEGLKSGIILKRGTILLDSLSGRAFNGEIRGNISYALDETKEFSVNLKLLDLDARALASNLDLEKRIQMSGELSGDLALYGKGAHITALSAKLSAGQGILNVADSGLLQDLARSSKQPLDIVVEAFKNYHYNSGVASLGLQQGNLILQIDLEGEAGRRSLNIVVHDFNLGFFR